MDIKKRKFNFENLKEELKIKITALKKSRENKKNEKPSMTLRFNVEDKAIIEYLSFCKGVKQCAIIEEAFDVYFKTQQNLLNEKTK